MNSKKPPLGEPRSSRARSSNCSRNPSRCATALLSAGPAMPFAKKPTRISRRIFWTLPQNHAATPPTDAWPLISTATASSGSCFFWIRQFPRRTIAASKPFGPPSSTAKSGAATAPPPALAPKGSPCPCCKPASSKRSMPSPTSAKPYAASSGRCSHPCKSLHRAKQLRRLDGKMALLKRWCLPRQTSPGEPRMADCFLPAEVALRITDLAFLLHATNAWRFKPLLVGMLFARGRRTVSSWLRAGELSDDYRAYYYLLGSLGRKVKWLAAALLRRVLQVVNPGERILFAIDDTPTKRYGPHVEGAGIHHNPTPGPADQHYVYGHVWVTLALVVRHALWGTVEPAKVDLWLKGTRRFKD